MRRFLRVVPTRKAPLAFGGFLALPIFFASLMAVSLAIEKPKAYAWTRHGRLIRTYHDATASTEWRIWALAVVPPLLLVALGLVASHFRFGIFAVCAGGVAIAVALTVRLPRWERHHTARFPFGVDNYPDSSTSSIVARGEWEHNAASTVHSLVGYTIGLAIAGALIALFSAFRGRRGTALTSHSEVQQTGGAPTVSEL